MFRRLYLRDGCVIAIAALLAFPMARATAEPKENERSRPLTYEGPAPGVKLQPFTLDAPAQRAIRVAYYAPRQTPRAEPNESTDDSDEDSQPQTRSSGPTVPGNRAVLRGGIAYAPANAPHRVKEAIWAVNAIRRKPYHWGGGHGSFYDAGYDCSGAVSYALHFAGAQSAITLRRPHALRRVWPRALDHNLQPARSHFRHDCWSAFGHNGFRPRRRRRSPMVYPTSKHLGFHVTAPGRVVTMKKLQALTGIHTKLLRAG